MEPLLSVDEAAALLGVNRKTVFTLIAQGLPHQRLSKRVIRFRAEELLAWGRTSNVKT